MLSSPAASRTNITVIVSQFGSLSGRICRRVDLTSASESAYLAGEPIVVVFDVRNVGDAPIIYELCHADVRLIVSGVEPRTPPRIHACGTGFGVSGGGCGGSHPPRLLPGQSKMSRHLLKAYDLPPGRHQLIASGQAGVRRNDHTAVPGAKFEQTLPFEVIAASDAELRCSRRSSQR
jgi:hypothetical protein